MTADGTSSGAPLASPTARAIIGVARRLLTERGFDALSFDSVARELGVDKGTIRYHFGSKNGLVMAVADSLGHDSLAANLREAHELGQTESREALCVLARRMLLMNEAREGWLDFLPYALRDPELMELKAELYRDFYSLTLEWVGLEPPPPGLSPKALIAFGAAMTALLDGLAIQTGLNTITLDDAGQAMALAINSTLPRLATVESDETARVADGCLRLTGTAGTRAVQFERAFSLETLPKRAADVSPTGEAIIAAARRLLTERGYRSLSFERVSREAGVHRDTVRYHFGTKLELVTAVCESLVRDLIGGIVRETREQAGGGLRDSTSVVARKMLLANDARGGWLDFLPYALRDPELRELNAELYREAYSLNLDWFGLKPPPPGLSPTVLARFAAVVTALKDGLAIQVGLGTIGLDEAAEVMGLVLDSTLEGARSLAAVSQ